MAKYRDRVFEMYEFRDEAILALTPKMDKTAADPGSPQLWSLTNLAVLRSGEGLALVHFKENLTFGEEAVAGLREDFSQLTDRLGKDSKVLFDFTGVESFGDACIDSLILLNKQLQTKGSRIALCCLNAALRESVNSHTRKRVH